MILISSPVLTLRHFTRADLNLFTRYRQNPDVALYQSWENFTFEQAEAMFTLMKRMPFAMPDNWYQIAIEHAEFGLVGDFGLHFVDEYQVELGVTIDPAWQGKGIGKSSLKLLLNYLFEDLQKHRVYAVTDIRNQASYSLFQSANFRREGHYIKNCFIKSEWCSEYLYAILAEEWRQ